MVGDEVVVKYATRAMGEVVDNHNHGRMDIGGGCADDVDWGSGGYAGYGWVLGCRCTQRTEG